MLIHIQNLVDNAKCYEVVRHLRWPDGVHCPACGSAQVSKRGHPTHQKECQRYECQSCEHQFDDTCTCGKCRCLTETIFEGHHQPLKVWILCLMLPHVQQATIQPISTRTVQPGSLLYTDEYDIYNPVSDWPYAHKTVNHSQGEYARDEDGDAAQRP